MPLIRALAQAVGTSLRAARAVVRQTLVSGRWATRKARSVRDRGAAGEAGMTRLFDLHAASCAGDTLVAIGLAGTIFFAVPAGEARSKVALYLLVTMVPFALLAPVVGPLLDQFRHGRRYALAATMLGRAFLAWMISDYIHGFGLYPAAFGVLALSRAYGVARSAAVPRLLPDGLGLSEAGARASVYGTIAGAAVVPIGVAAFTLGPQWPLRVASVIFLVGMVVALRLPPRADSDAPEAVPAPFRWMWWRDGGPRKVLSGRLVVAAVTGSAALRALYGFLLLFCAFAIRSGTLPTRVGDVTLSAEAAMGLVGGALGLGTFLSTAVGTRLRIRRPVALQATGMLLVAVLAALTTLRFHLPMVAALCLATAVASGLAKLAVDASIQERIHEHVRASAFAHAETLLMLSWVAGGAIGLVPVDGRIGIGVAAGAVLFAAVRSASIAGRTFSDRLLGRASSTAPAQTRQDEPSGPADRTVARSATPAPGSTAHPPDPAAPSPGSAAQPRDRGRPASGPVRRRPGPPPASAPAPPPVDDSLAPPGFHIYRPSPAERVGDEGGQGDRGSG
ncbi:MAG TPA: MFS transporter [Micromonosporaceae bacterium]|nr:MFS transporter [Micromonosporaceae bacterium]